MKRTPFASDSPLEAVLKGLADKTAPLPKRAELARAIAPYIYPPGKP